MIQPLSHPQGLEFRFYKQVCTCTQMHTEMLAREEKINHLIDKDRFDLFDYLTLPVYIPGGLHGFLINFGILAVHFRFLTTTLQRHPSYFPAASEKWPGDAQAGPCPGSWRLSRAPGLSASERPFTHPTCEETKTSKLKASGQLLDSCQLALRGNNKTKKPLIRPPGTTSPSANLLFETARVIFTPTLLFLDKKSTAKV